MRIMRWCRIDRNGCVQCRSREFQLRPVLEDHLAETWGLTRRLRSQFDEREGHSCTRCQMSRRVRMLLWSIRRLFPEIENVSVLHLNQINALSESLRKANRLVETFYDSSQPMGAKRDVCINQDMQALEFESEQFDLVIHSETLEHLHGYDRALSECNRVLKPGGFQVYTVPLIKGRTTRRRIGTDSNGDPIPLLPISYHGLGKDYQVVWEFGGDFLESRKPYLSELHYDNYWLNPTIFTMVEKKH